MWVSRLDQSVSPTAADRDEANDRHPINVGLCVRALIGIKISSMQSKGVAQAQKRIREAMVRLPGVKILPHRFGGVEFRLERCELGHIHGDWLVDIPFPKKVRDQIVAAGEAEPHHILPASGWVSVFLRTEEDVDRATQLLQRSFSMKQGHSTA
jgi:luciferase-like monooxygenase